MRNLFYWGGAYSSGVASENGTGVAPEDGTGVENRCDFNPLDLLNHLKYVNHGPSLVRGLSRSPFFWRIGGTELTTLDKG